MKSVDISIKSMRSDTRYLNVATEGNKKLINNNDTRFIIWNLPAVTTCPYRTAECEESCYARKAERIYPKCLPSRKRNFEESLKASFVTNMIYTIEAELKINKRKGIKHTVVRIHESGDFYNEAYADKWLKIANHFSDNDEVIFMAYTKSLDYFIGKKISDNIVIRYSAWCDTSTTDKYRACCNGFTLYEATDRIEAWEDDPDISICRCSDCATCGMCWDRNNEFIVCKIH